MSTPTIKRYHAGLTLIELVLFIVIISVGVAGLLSVMNLVTRTSADPLPRKQAMAAAEALLEEIQLKQYSNPAGGFTGPYTQTKRPEFDDIFDYNGFGFPITGLGIFPADGSAGAVSGLGQYRVDVAVTAGVGSELGNAAIPAARITVTVTTPTGEAIKSEGYKTDHL